MFQSFIPLLWTFCTLLHAATALPTVSAVGAKFFTSDGKQWFVKGIAYQRSPDDPLLDGDQCTTDAKLMSTLGTNSIRVYHVNPNGNHDACMKAFEAAGIYVFIDLDTFDTYLLNLGSQPTWSAYQFTRYAAVMDAFASYDNTAGFFVGNEVIFTNAESFAAPYIKAAARDMKAYRQSKGYRSIPVGYAAADIAELRPQLQNYLVCGGDSGSTIDFYGLNSYEWCGVNTYQTSGYSNLQAMAAGYPAPIFFSETGCNVAPPRTFADQAAIFGPDMDGTWSGAMIYEWMQEQNDYGLISYGGTAQNPARVGTPTPLEPDFDNLKSAWKISPSSVALSDYQQKAKQLSTPACPAATPGGWSVNGNVALPAVQAQTVQLSSSVTAGMASITTQPEGTSSLATGSTVHQGTTTATVTSGMSSPASAVSAMSSVTSANVVSATSVESATSGMTSTDTLSESNSVGSGASTTAASSTSTAKSSSSKGFEVSALVGIICSIATVFLY